MIHKMNEQVKEYGKRHKKNGRWGRLLALMAVLVVFGTTYALILPGVTLDRETMCGQQEHTHTAEVCYGSELVCAEEDPAHVHGEACYTSVLTCALPEHTHTEVCCAAETEPAQTAARTAAPEPQTVAQTAAAETEGQTEGTEKVTEGVTESQTAAAAEPQSEPQSETRTEGVTETEGQPATETEGQTETGTEAETAAGTETETETETGTEPETPALAERTLNAVLYADASCGALSAEPVTITLTGMLPEGVTVRAYPVDVELEDETVQVVKAYDIGLFLTVTDPETGAMRETEYEPEGTVQVKIASAKLGELANVDVYHIADEPGAVPEKVQEDVAVCADTVEFGADAFSTYVLAAAADGAAPVDVTQDGSSFTMAVGDTLTVNEQSGHSHSYVASCRSGRNTYTSSSSNTNVATLSVSNGIATVTAVGAGSTTVTLYYSSSYGWSSYSFVTLDITVEGEEQAALYFLKNPNADPISNDTGGWVPDSTKNQSQIIGTVNTAGATWVNNKNVTSNPGNYIVSWPDGSTNGSAWTIDSQNTYFTQILNLVFDEWKSELEKELGISNLQKNDVTSITITPCKISKDNGTSPDKHIDCRIVLVSDKFFKTQFWVKEPGAADYDLKAYKFFKEGTAIPEPNRTNYSNYTYGYQIGDTRVVDGVTYVLTGWYTENAGGTAHSGTTAKFAYTPSTAELADGTVNFYAEWVQATGSLTIKKVDSADAGKILSGAVFTLIGGADFEAMTLTTGADGTAEAADIPVGEYTLTETTAPAGYNLLTEQIKLTVSADKVTASYGSGSSNMVSTEGTTVTVKNSAGAVLPNTGGAGTWPFEMAGLLMAVVSGQWFVRRRGK